MHTDVSKTEDTGKIRAADCEINNQDFSGRCMHTCPHMEFCGGCIYQGVPYEQQLSNKFEEVRELLEARHIEYDRLLPIEPAPSRFGYRNKMEYTFGDMVKDGPTTLGMHRKGHFMSIVTVDQCQLVHPDFNAILKATLDFANERGYSHYHKRRHTGLMRHLILRRGVRTGELLVNICTSSEGEPGMGREDRDRFDEEAYAKAIMALPLENTVVGVLHTINDRLADAVYCDELRVLEGRDYYNEEIMGLKFRVSAFSFFQTNVDAVEKLYTYAVNLIDDFSDKKAFDLFCGTGTITQVLARKASEVLGVEIVEEAVEMARATARLNGLDNCRFIAGDCFKVLDSIDDKPEVIVVDPPRVGIKNDALEKIIGYGVDQIVYISCNPKSLVENLYYMQYYGYEVVSVKPFDNFPGTKHVETVVLLSGEKVDGHIDIDLDVEKLEEKSGTATYAEIKAYIKEKYGFSVTSLYIGQIKDKTGIKDRKNYNTGSGKGRVPTCPADKEEAIMDAFRHFGLI